MKKQNKKKEDLEKLKKVNMDIIRVADELKVSPQYRDLVVEFIDRGEENLISSEHPPNRTFVIWYKIYSQKEFRKTLSHKVILRELKKEVRNSSQP